MSTVCSRGDATSLYVKGAPDSVIARCTRVRREDGSIGPLDEALRSALIDKVHAMASRPLRCLALATKEVSDWEDVERGGPAAHEAFESDLVLEGVAGIRDPPRPEAKRAIQRCKSAGVRVFMITGDSKETAVAIGKELGILESESAPGRATRLRIDGAEAGPRKDLLARRRATRLLPPAEADKRAS